MVRHRFTGEDVSIPWRRADLAEDAQRGRGGVGQLARLRLAERILELRQHERVDPLGVRRALDVVREVGRDVLEQVEAHAAELAQVAVVGERDARAGEAERVQVGLGHHLALALGDAAHVGDQAGRSELGARWRLRSNAGSVVTR